MQNIQIVALVLLCALSPAQAEVPWPERLDVDLQFRKSAAYPEGTQWDFRLGLGIESEPTYQGSDQTQTEVDPFVLLAYRADWGNVFLTSGGLGFSKMITDRFGIALQLEAEDTREVADDERLIGLGDQDEELELEIIGRYFLGPLALGGSVAPATGDKGVVWFLGGTYTWRTANDRLFFTVGADLSGSSRDNQQTDFGITDVQSAASGFPVYSPGGGLKSFGVNLTAEYQVSENWFVYAQIDNERLLGDIADSPIVFDKNNSEIGVGVFYNF